MYPEITSKLRKIDEVTEAYYHVDSRLDRLFKELRDGMEFLAKKVWELEKRSQHSAVSAHADPHRHIPGSDD
jgi:hypothetical protein